LYLAERRVLIGTSVFYPAPGSMDYALCASMGLLPKKFSGMRSSALPVSHTTTRKEAITLLRLSRIANFMKHLIDCGQPLPVPAPAIERIENPQQRERAGEQLLQFFLDDGIIRGVDSNGTVFEHDTSRRLCSHFLAGIASDRIRGCKR
ncbi:MAG: radical SAM protein, partial [Desulfobacterales bacterium]